MDNRQKTVAMQGKNNSRSLTAELISMDEHPGREKQTKSYCSNYETFFNDVCCPASCWLAR